MANGHLGFTGVACRRALLDELDGNRAALEQMAPRSALRFVLWLALHYTAPAERLGAIGEVIAAIAEEEADPIGLAAPTSDYPPGWPRCGCGRPVLDGHLTCGEVRCSESVARAFRNAGG